LKSIVKTKVEKEEIEKKSKYIFYEPYFESFRTMKSKFVKNNSSFVLIETSWNSYI
jgi:hypothetical protein